MKTSILLILMMVLSLGASAQFHVLKEEIEVKPPIFMGTAVSVVDNGASLDDFVAQRMIYPEQDLKLHREGTEVIQFTVNTNGTLSDFEVVNSVSPNMDAELIRVLQLTNGMWRPGSNNDGHTEMRSELAIACKIRLYEGSDRQTDFQKVATKYFQKGSKLLYTKNHPRRALSNFDEGIRYLPYDANLLVMRGYARYALGDLAGAIEDWEIVKEKTDIDNLKEIAGNYHDLEGYAELLAEFEK
ncbi:energy transducer TonB [Mangrovibacterium marinum]|uniref:TonB family protein n=1 Tax=Mangrovibacterium marinum TaxID=1639118 RepID=A0A2T5C4W5_9BACT|nr:energy transducer TonB [Mangrovibacterium marinum]PTN09899.1 TonB family protein [Mangrovibacterium marinum]